MTSIRIAPIAVLTSSIVCVPPEYSSAASNHGATRSNSSTQLEAQRVFQRPVRCRTVGEDFDILPRVYNYCGNHFRPLRKRKAVCERRIAVLRALAERVDIRVGA